MMKRGYLGGGVREGENERMLVVLGHFLTDLRDGWTLRGVELWGEKSNIQPEWRRQAVQQRLKTVEGLAEFRWRFKGKKRGLTNDGCWFDCLDSLEEVTDKHTLMCIRNLVSRDTSNRSVLKIRGMD
jgi:hypothetical protein